MTDKTRTLIHIAREENHIELLGYRIDGYDSLEAFLEKLNKFAELEKEVVRLNTELRQKVEYIQEQRDVIDELKDEIEKLNKAIDIHKMIADDWKYEAKRLERMVGTDNDR